MKHLLSDLVELLKNTPSPFLLIEAEIGGGTVRVNTSKRTVDWNGHLYLGINCTMHIQSNSMPPWVALNVKTVPLPFYSMFPFGTDLKLGHIRFSFALADMAGGLIGGPELLCEGELCRLVPLSCSDLYALIRLDGEDGRRPVHSSNVNHDGHCTVDMTTTDSPRQERYCKTCAMIYDAGPLIDPEKDKEAEQLNRRNGLAR